MAACAVACSLLVFRGTSPSMALSSRGDKSYHVMGCSQVTYYYVREIAHLPSSLSLISLPAVRRPPFTFTEHKQLGQRPSCMQHIETPLGLRAARSLRVCAQNCPKSSSCRSRIHTNGAGSSQLLLCRCEPFANSLAICTHGVVNT